MNFMCVNGVHVCECECAGKRREEGNRARRASGPPTDMPYTEHVGTFLIWQPSSYGNSQHAMHCACLDLLSLVGRRLAVPLY